MKIEVGKYYRTRDGRKAKVKETGARKYPFYIEEDDIKWHGLTVDGESCVGMSEFDLISEWESSPVRTVTRKEIVPGVYGNIEVYWADENSVKIGLYTACYMSADIRAAAATLIEIADALDDK